MLKIAVLISGGGTNLQAIIDNVKSGYINAEIALVVSSKEDAYGLVRAKTAGIEGITIKKSDYKDIKSMNVAIIEKLKVKGIGLVVLAGYMSILHEDFIKEFRNKIINVHPSLIPSFCGVGYYGSRVHESVIKYGAKVSGATVHFVDEGADTGPIIFQQCVEVFDHDDAETLAKRVLSVEHKLLPKAVAYFVDGKLTVQGRKVYAE